MLRRRHVQCQGPTKQSAHGRLHTAFIVVIGITCIFIMQAAVSTHRQERRTVYHAEVTPASGSWWQKSTHGSTPVKVEQPWCPNQNSSPSGSTPVTPFPVSFWMVKTFKTGGSTLAGVFGSINAHYGIVPVPIWATKPETLNWPLLRAGFAVACNASFTGAVSIQAHRGYMEEIAALFRTAPCAAGPLLLFTSVRHPVSRVHSSYAQDSCTSTARTMVPGVDWADQQCSGLTGGNASLLQLALQNDSTQARWEYIKQHPKELNFNYIRGSAKTPQEVAEKYAFVFVQERMYESLVAFMLQYGLRFEDIAHLSAKNRTGIYKSHKQMPEELNHYIKSIHPNELALWQLANEKLDEHIQSLDQRCGPGVFQAALQTYKQLQAEVHNQCSDWQQWYASHGFKEPYSFQGDAGIAPRCVRHAARQFLSGARHRERALGLTSN